jgi:hypothetical protein
LLVHTVTKVLVVFAAVLCVLLAALTMAYSINADRITGDYRDALARMQSAQSEQAAAVAQAQEQAGRDAQTIASLQNQLTDKQTEIAALQSQRTDLLAQVETARSETLAVRGQIDAAIASTNTVAQINKAMTDELGKLRDNELASKRREIELTDRLNDLESQREVLDQSVRSLQEQLAEANRTIQSGGISSRTSGTQGPYTPNVAISGKVIATGQDPATKKPMATINVGSNDRVRENMQLVISRNGQFLGNFVVTRTDLQWSMGQVDSLGKNVDIREGDQVSSLAGR